MTISCNSKNETQQDLDLVCDSDLHFHCPSPISLLSRKRVHFSSQLTIVQNRFTLSEKSKSQLWWQREDYLQFKCEIVLQARALRQQPLHGFEMAVPRAEAISSDAKDDNEVEAFLHIIHLDTTLHQWCSSIYRGLETYSSRIAKERNRQRASNLTKVAVLSARLTTDDIRRLAESHSRVDRILARMLGVGDAMAVTPFGEVVSKPSSTVRRLSFTVGTPLPLRYN